MLTCREGRLSTWRTLSCEQGRCGEGNGRTRAYILEDADARPLDGLGREEARKYRIGVRRGAEAGSQRRLLHEPLGVCRGGDALAARVEHGRVERPQLLADVVARERLVLVLDLEHGHHRPIKAEALEHLRAHVLGTCHQLMVCSVEGVGGFLEVREAQERTSARHGRLGGKRPPKKPSEQKTSTCCEARKSEDKLGSTRKH